MKDVEQDTPQYWFPVKRYGWGWGLYFASIYLGIRYLDPRDNVGGFLLVLAIATVVLIAVCAWKGEKPLAWRWGE
jgi:uncharacterized membrane protein